MIAAMCILGWLAFFPFPIFLTKQVSLLQKKAPFRGLRLLVGILEQDFSPGFKLPVIRCVNLASCRVFLA